jgi:hypothetical protein
MAPAPTTSAMDTETLFLLRAARETGLLAALLEAADDADAAAATAGVDERAAALTVEVLVAEGFLARVGDAVEPTDRLLGFLAAADLRSVGGLPAAVDAADALAALPETLESGDPPAGGEPRHRLGARAALPESTVRAAVTAAVRAVPDAETVLDPGGAPGRFAVEFAARGCDVTLADDPDAVETSTPLLAREPVATVPVEQDEALPSGFDLVFAADATVGRQPADNGERVAALADAATDGGAVVLVERLWGRSADAVPAAVESFARDGGRVYREETAAEWFAAAGLDGPRVEPIPGTERFALVGRP